MPTLAESIQLGSTYQAILTTDFLRALFVRGFDSANVRLRLADGCYVAVTLEIVGLHYVDDSGPAIWFEGTMVVTQTGTTFNCEGTYDPTSELVKVTLKELVRAAMARS